MTAMTASYGERRTATGPCRYPLISRPGQQSEERAMGDIGPERRRIEVLPTTEPVLPAPARPAPRRTPVPAPVTEPVKEPAR